MIGLIEVASHILCLWQAALLPPFEADVAAAAVVMGGTGGESHRGQGQAASFITQVLNIISFSTCDESNNLWIQSSSGSHWQFSISWGRRMKILHSCV